MNKFSKFKKISNPMKQSFKKTRNKTYKNMFYQKMTKKSKLLILNQSKLLKRKTPTK